MVLDPALVSAPVSAPVLVLDSALVLDIAQAVDSVDILLDLEYLSSAADTVLLIEKEVNSVLETAYPTELYKLKSASKKELRIAIPAGTKKELETIRPMTPINYVILLVMLWLEKIVVTSIPISTLLKRLSTEEYLLDLDWRTLKNYY